VSADCPVGNLNDDCQVNWEDLRILTDQWLSVLSADVAPDGGDGIVNFLDWAAFADSWQVTNGIEDLAAFVDQWLKYGVYSADIAPVPDGDNTVNMLDFAVFANYWFEGVE